MAKPLFLLLESHQGELARLMSIQKRLQAELEEQHKISKDYDEFTKDLKLEQVRHMNMVEEPKAGSNTFYCDHIPDPTVHPTQESEKIDH